VLFLSVLHVQVLHFLAKYRTPGSLVQLLRLLVFHITVTQEGPRGHSASLCYHPGCWAGNTSGLRGKKLHVGSYCGSCLNYKSGVTGSLYVPLWKQISSLGQEECSTLHSRAPLGWAGWAARCVGLSEGSLVPSHRNPLLPAQGGRYGNHLMQCTATRDPRDPSCSPGSPCTVTEPTYQ